MSGLQLAECFTSVLQDENGLHSVLLRRPSPAMPGSWTRVRADRVATARVYAMVRHHAGRVWMFVGVKGFAGAWDARGDVHIATIMTLSGRVCAWMFPVPDPDAPLSACARMAAVADPARLGFDGGVPTPFRIRFSTAVTAGVPTPVEAQHHLLRRLIRHNICIHEQSRHDAVSKGRTLIKSYPAEEPTSSLPASKHLASKHLAHKTAASKHAAKRPRPTCAGARRASPTSWHVRGTAAGEDSALAVGPTVHICGHALNITPDARYVIAVTKSTCEGVSATIREPAPPRRDKDTNVIMTRAAKRQRTQAGIDPRHR